MYKKLIHTAFFKEKIMTKNKVTISLLIAFIATLGFYFLLNDVWKIKVNIKLENYNPKNDYVLSYMKHNKTIEEKLSAQNENLAAKVRFNAYNLAIYEKINSEITKIDDKEINTIYINKIKINNFNEFNSAKNQIKQSMQVKFVLCSIVFGIFCSIVIFLIYFLIVGGISPPQNLTNFHIVLCILSLVFSFILLLKFAKYPILDGFGFRQTQSALTSLFMINNLSLKSIINYETPVLGIPYSIPLEFPLYQALCAFIAQITKADLSIVGRCVSYVFTIASLYPIYFICQKITKDKNLFYISAFLYLLSPLYLLYGRAFLIETFTVFLGLMFLANFLNYFDTNKKITLLNIFIFMTLCGLSKITTLYGFCTIALIYTLYKIKQKQIKLKQFLMLAFACLVSLGICFIWIKYSDSIKMLNYFGAKLTSANLTTWNYGTIKQRFSSEFYHIIFFRMFKDVLGNKIILLLSLIYLFFIEKKYINIALSFLATFFIIIFTFANLHYAHNYYQIANGIFLIFFVSIIYWRMYEKNKKIYLFFMALTVFSMVQISVKNFNIYNKAQNSPIVKIGEYIQNHSSSNDTIITIGQRGGVVV